MRICYACHRPSKGSRKLCATCFKQACSERGRKSDGRETFNTNSWIPQSLSKKLGK